MATQNLLKLLLLLMLMMRNSLLQRGAEGGFPQRKLYWCDPDKYGWQLNTCWSCYCCWCWRWVCCRFGSWGLVIKLHFCSDFQQKVWSRFWSWSSRQDFEAKVWSFCCWCLVEVTKLKKILKLCLVNILSLTLVEMLIFGRDFDVDAWSIFWRWNLIKICILTCDMT